METPIERPQTPPPSGLTLPLTPPLTGGIDKRVRFADAEQFNTSSRRQSERKEGESSDAFFEGLQEASDTEIHESSETESIPSTDTAPSSPASATSIPLNRTVLSKHDPFTSLALAIDAPRTITSPFPFMSLPISIRKRIYEHLLVIPGLICVRQKHTTFHEERKAFLYTERREYLPGIAYALAQLTVKGYKIRFSRFSTTNINILRASKEVFSEAKAILYGTNSFEIVRPTTELCPPPDFSVRLFPMGCQRLVTKLNIRIRSFYDLHWLLSGGYNVLKNYYRGLEALTLVLEVESAGKGFGKVWKRLEGETWAIYIQRLKEEVEKEIFRKSKGSNTKVVPVWMNLRVLFSGERYDEKMAVEGNVNAGTSKMAKRDELRKGLVETWELFKKGGK